MGRGLLLLVAAALSPVVALPPCFTNGTDGGLDIRGRWEEAPELLSAPGAASALRCRVEGAGARACMDHKASKKGAPVAEAGGRARRFVPETCELDPRVGVARARGLADAIGPHRTVFLLGDSLLMQHKSTLRCELESAGMLVNASGAMVGRAMVMHNSARVAFYRVSHLEHLKRQLYALANDPGAGIGQVRPTDVCVFNIGVHYNEQKPYQRELLDYFEAECLQKRCLPCQIVWRETTAQHFPGPRGGNFVAAGKCKGCVQIAPAEAEQHNWRNQAANHLMQRYNVPILRTWALTAMSAQLHPAVGGYAHSGCDCTHYCNFMGGVFDTWTNILLSFLASLPPAPPSPNLSPAMPLNRDAEDMRG